MTTPRLNLRDMSLSDLHDYAIRHKKETWRSHFWGFMSSIGLYRLRFLYHYYFSVCHRCGFPYPDCATSNKWGYRPVHFNSECLWGDDE